MSFFVALSTAGSEEEGQKIGQILVEQGLASCVNVISGVTSFFYWEGKFCKEQETILLIKTINASLNKIENKIREIHSYDTPELLFLKVERGEKNYLRWARKMAGKTRLLEHNKKNIDNKPSKR